MYSSHRRSHRPSTYPAGGGIWSPADMWRAFPIRSARPRDLGSIMDSDITIVQQPRPRYANYRTPPVNSYPRYSVHRDIRDWDEWDDDYEVPVALTPRNVDRTHHDHLRHSRPVPPTEERGGRSSRRSSRDGRDKVDFEKACTKLKKLLHTAIKQFRKLEQEFQEETKLIENYASKRILDDLWKRKIGVDQELEENDDLDDIDQEMQTHSSRSYFLERKVILCLSRIVDASVDGRKDDIERQSDMLLRTKIEASMQCITEIWPKINSSRKQCTRLLTELTQLYEVLKAAYPQDAKEVQGDTFDNSNAQEDNGGGQNWQ